MIDLRSDTVTRPTDRMRTEMASAEVGDDVLGEDPTVQQLEERSAELFGKEAALFFPSGTMANQVAISAWTDPGEEMILDRDSHIYDYELGMFAIVSSVVARPVSSDNGELPVKKLKDAYRFDHPMLSQTGLVCVENTHNMHGGRVVSVDHLERIRRFSSERNLPIHLDGARIFNAAVARNGPPSAFADHVDSVMFSISKGLSAPVGSVLVGPESFIEECRRIRKRMGGGMRQAGIIAAAGIIAIEEMVDRLERDHEHATEFAEQLTDHPLVEVRPDTVETNIVLARVKDSDLDSEGLIEEMSERGVKAVPVDERTIRFVFHRHIEEEDVDQAVDRLFDLECI